MLDLFALRDYEPPMGDTAGRGGLGDCRAIWTTPTEAEQVGDDPAPARRIVHARVLQLHAPARLHRLGLRLAQGYHKCGSTVDRDWVTSFRLRVWDGDVWRTHAEASGIKRPEPGETLWFDLGGIETATALVEVRRCGVDGWWPSWNLVTGALVLEGEAATERPLVAPRCETLLGVTEVALAGLPEGLTAKHEHGEVRFRSAHLDVGFCLNRAGFSYLALDEASGLLAPNAPSENLLRHGPGRFYQGPMLAPLGGPPVAASVLRNQAHGTTQVHGNRVTYTLALGDTGQRLRLAWEVLPDRLVLRAERRADTSLRAWTASAWTFGLHSVATPAHAIGATERSGQTGRLTLPAWLHAPRFGSLLIESIDHDGAAALRSDAVRPNDLTTLDLLLGAEPQPEGDYLLPPGCHAATVTFRLSRPDVPLAEGTPRVIRRAIDRCALTALTYRADTATLTNNGASMHCPICMDTWTATATRLGRVLPHLDALDLVRDALERWLDGGQGYTSGRLRVGGVFHEAEDEYVMTGTACLLGLADYLAATRDADWLARYADVIGRQLAKMRARDLDGDGLVESPYRTGTSGSGQWSTCWFDVISYGWKDAFSNALLYPALVRLADVLPALGRPDLADGLADWAALLRQHYVPTFLNEETGWLAGWRCRDDRLHDHAFLAPNGAAIVGGLLDDDLARGVMQRLWAETQRVGMPDPYLGLPGNLRPIPDEDLADIMQGYPLGFYQNGGRTHSQARHFVGALYRVGMTREADYVLSRLAAGLADAAVFGGSRSGLDWRYWDGRPCGYEGLLTDQFGILGVMLDRYGTP